jgi:hypothetical protein
MALGAPIGYRLLPASAIGPANSIDPLPPSSASAIRPANSIDAFSAKN